MISKEVSACTQAVHFVLEYWNFLIMSIHVCGLHSVVHTHRGSRWMSLGAEETGKETCQLLADSSIKGISKRISLTV